MAKSMFKSRNTLNRVFPNLSLKIFEEYTDSYEGYIEELSRFSQCLNVKTGFVNFRSVYQSFLY